MPIILHVGTHKTGTTSIQRFASSHRRELRERGLWYPSYNEIGFFNHYAHHHVAHALSGQSGYRLSESDALLFSDHIRRNRKPNETVLLSAEPFYRHTRGGDTDFHRNHPASAAYWVDRDAYVAKMREAFPSDDTKILICIRRQDEFARSNYQERVKVTKYTGTFGDFLKADAALFDYLRQVEIFAKHFPKVSVITFDELTKAGDLSYAFFKRLGVDISFTNRRPITNVSLPLEFIEFKRLANQTKMPLDRASAIGKKLEHMAEKGILRPDKNLDWMSFGDLAAFQASFDSDNEHLRERFAPHFPAPLFSPPVPSDKKVFTGLPSERAVQIAYHSMS